MNSFYIDESIHERGEFILGAYVYGPDPESAIDHALRQCGLEPGKHEFKSSASMTLHPEQAALRDRLREFLAFQYRIGMVITPTSARADLGRETLLGLGKIVRANKLLPAKPPVFLDEGIFSSPELAFDLADRIGISELCDLFPEQDSRQVKGIQLADLVAHTCSTMLLETLGLVAKQVKAGPNSGYDPDLEFELGFELWAGIRYQFFSGGLPEAVQSNDDMVVDVASYGLHIADSCPERLRECGSRTFRQVLPWMHPLNGRFRGVAA